MFELVWDCADDVISIGVNGIGSNGAVALAPTLAQLTGLQYLEYVCVRCCYCSIASVHEIAMVMA